MRDASKNWFRAIRMAPRAAMAAMLVAIACGLGGCAGGGAVNGSYAMASGGNGSGATVAFESIDGPPPQVFDRLVSVLDSESKLRNLSIVSRQDQASYRVKSYLAAEVNHGRTTIAWVWDVYDGNQQRALRLSGEEPAGKSGRDAWTAADDLVASLAARADAGDTAAASHAAMAKLTGTRAAITAVEQAVALVGNNGLTRKYPLERHYRDVLCSRVHTPQDDSIVAAAGKSALEATAGKLA